MGNARARGERGLQLGHRRPHDEAAVLKNLSQRRIDSGLEAPVLRAQVDEGDGIVTGVVIVR